MSLFNLNSFYIIYIVIVFGDMRVAGDKHTSYFFGLFKEKWSCFGFSGGFIFSVLIIKILKWIEKNDIEFVLYVNSYFCDKCATMDQQEVNFHFS